MLLIILAVSVTQARPAHASGTRYLDPIFSGDLAPVTEFSYDPDIQLNEQQILTVKAWAGSYTLSAGGSTTPPIPATAPAASVQAALQALPSLDFDGISGGDVVVTGGPGGVFGGHHYDISFTAPAPPGGYPRLTATNVDLVNPLGPAVVVQCVRCGDVYRPNEPEPPTGGRPVVVIAHSGGFVLGAKDSASGDITGPRMERWATELAERGYVAVPINYSLAQPDDLAAVFSCEWDAPAEPGTPCPSVVTNAALAVQHDIQGAVRWLRWSALPASAGGLDNPFGIDPNRISVLGESAGAVGALGALYRREDPGSVGITSTDSTVAAAVSIAGFTTDADQDAGEGPALLMAFTNDLAGELFGFDLYDENREVVSRARQLGNDAELVSYCQRQPNGSPSHLPELTAPEFNDQVDNAVSFLYRVLIDTSSGTPADDEWGRDDRSFISQAGQRMQGPQRGYKGDFNGDGRDDILWYGSGGTCDTVWFGRSDRTFTDPREFNGTSFAPALDIGGNYEPVVGDYDGDGHDDILWYEPATGAQTLISYGNADGSFQTIQLGSTPIGLTLASGDFDGDGNDDLVVTYRPAGLAIVAFGTATRGVFDLRWAPELPGTGLAPWPGDFDGDGRDDVLWYDDMSGLRVTAWYGNSDRTVTQIELGNLVGDLDMLVADFDGDGHDDVFVNHGASQLAAGFRGTPSRGVFSAFFFEVSGTWDHSATGDFDGDGRADIVWSGALSSVWYGETGVTPNAMSRIPRPAVPTHGAVPLSGDFDGDGRGDLHWTDTAS